MNCTNIESNMKDCTCSYPGCPRKGKCCECVAYHRASRQLPGCFFSKEGEQTWDRSFENFVRTTVNRK